MRLARYLAMAGVDARRNCEAYIAAGRVSVDRETITDPAFKVDPDKHDVRLDGEKLQTGRRAYFLLNKPRGYLCTNADPQGRKRVIELFPDHHGRLFSVGRLDENSQGLLVVTNDGDLAERLAHPRYAVPKVYHVLVAGVPEPRFADKLVRGMRFDEGIFKVHAARLLKSKGQSSLLEITLTEGQNREIRRLLARLGHKVMRLERVALGPIKLGALPIGAYRPLLREEVDQLLALLKVPARARVRERPRSAEGGKARGDRTPEASVVQRREQKARELRAESGERPPRGTRPQTRRQGPPGRASRPVDGSPVAGSRASDRPDEGHPANKFAANKHANRKPRIAVETEEGDTLTAPGTHPAIARATRGARPGREVSPNPRKPQPRPIARGQVRSERNGRKGSVPRSSRRGGDRPKRQARPKGRKIAAKRPGAVAKSIETPPG